MANIIWTGFMGKTATTLGWQTNTVNFSPCQVTATVALASYGALMLGKAVALTLLGFAGWTYRAADPPADRTGGRGSEGPLDNGHMRRYIWESRARDRVMEAQPSPR
jgi:hypothetical protein